MRWRVPFAQPRSPARNFPCAQGTTTYWLKFCRITRAKSTRLQVNYKDLTFKRKRWLPLYPDDALKIAWNSVMIVLLLLTLVILPLRLAMGSIDTSFGWVAFDMCFDFL